MARRTSRDVAHDTNRLQSRPRSTLVDDKPRQRSPQGKQSPANSIRPGIAPKPWTALDPANAVPTTPRPIAHAVARYDQPRSRRIKSP